MKLIDTGGWCEPYIARFWIVQDEGTLVSWIDELNLDHSELLSGASEDRLETVEQSLGVRFPVEHREFLRHADGGFVGHRSFLLYSAGSGIHPAETLLAANQDREPDFPLLAVGCDASDDFGFRKCELSLTDPPIYFIFHETGEMEQVAPSFRSFLREISVLMPGEPFIPPHRRKSRH